MIVNSGLNLMRDLLSDPTKMPPSHFAVGTGTNQVSANDTALESEVARVALAAKAGPSPGVFSYVGELLSTDANGNNLSEMGVLNAASGGDMLLRKKHAAYSKAADFSVKYVIKHTITNV